VTPTQAITNWANRWRNLKAWKRTLDNVQVMVMPYKGTQAVGKCFPSEQRVKVFSTGDICHDLSTVLHELAHAACRGGTHHNEAWQECYANATTEVTQIQIPKVASEFTLMDRASESAIRSWWQSSGEAYLWSMLRR
jgi:hypothetical protein